MVAQKAIVELSRQIVEQFGAHRVILFGSYARGEATEDSDVDLLVVMPFSGRSVEASARIRLMLRPSFPVDLLVRTPQTIRERIDQGDTFLRDIIENGKVVYAADNG